MHWLSGAVLALGFGLAASAAASCPRDHGGDGPRRDCYGAGYHGGAFGERDGDLYDARRYDRRAPSIRDRWDEYGDAGRYPPYYEAYPDPRDDWRDGRNYPQTRWRDEDRYGPAPEPARYGASPWYRDGRRPEPICSCPDRFGSLGAVRLPGGFFDDAGGVGPIPYAGDGYGGRYGFTTYGYGGSSFSRATASAYSSARASSSTTVMVNRGGRRGGGHMGGHGGKRH